MDTLPNDAGHYAVTTTSGTTYTFALDVGTVTRTPGELSHPDINDGTRPIRHVFACRVGYSGYWTMEPDNEELDCYWQLTSPIVAIESLDRGERASDA